MNYTHGFMLKAIRKTEGRAFTALQNPAKDICLAAIEINGMLLEHVDNQIQENYQEIALVAVR